MCQCVCVYVSGGGVCASEGGVYVCVLVGASVGNVFGVDKRYCPRHSLAHQVKLCALACSVLAQSPEYMWPGAPQRQPLPSSFFHFQRAPAPQMMPLTP